MSFSDLSQEEAPPVSPAVTQMKKKLSEGVEKILKEAGSNLKSSLFKSGKGDDTIDAAE